MIPVFTTWPNVFEKLRGGAGNKRSSKKVRSVKMSKYLMHRRNVKYFRIICMVQLKFLQYLYGSTKLTLYFNWMLLEF